MFSFIAPRPHLTLLTLADSGQEITTPTTMSSVKEDEKTADGSEEKDVEEVPQTFPQKLMEILSDEANTEIIAWLRKSLILVGRWFNDRTVPSFLSPHGASGILSHTNSSWQGLSNHQQEEVCCRNLAQTL